MNKYLYKFTGHYWLNGQWCLIPSECEYVWAEDLKKANWLIKCRILKARGYEVSAYFKFNCKKEKIK